MTAPTGKRAELLALAERVEALQRTDRAVDADIALAVGYANCRPPSGDNVGRFPHENPYGAGFFGPAYTTSLDAALSLVPEGCGHALWAVIGKRPCASIQFASHEGLPPLTVTADGWLDWCAGVTPALALVSACLKARAAMEPDDAE